MRHDFLPLAVAPGPSGVRKAPRTRVLVAPAGLTQAGPARLLATALAAVALAAVTAAAQQHLSLAQRTREHPSAARLGIRCPGSRHRPLRSELQSAWRSRLCLSVGRDPPVGAILRPHCVLYTVGRGGLNNCPVVLAAAPVLASQGSALVLLSRHHPQEAGAASLVRRLSSARRSRRPPSPTAPAQACPRRRAGVACNERTTAAVGKPCSTRRPHQHRVNAAQPAHYRHRMPRRPHWLGQFR